MRLNKIDTTIEDGKLNLEMDMPEGNSPFCVVFSNGKAKLTFLPDHGETKVITHQGKVKRVKWNQGEEF